MVFGWGKKKQRDEPVRAAPQRSEIGLNDVPGILAELNQTKAAHAVHDIIYLRDAVTPLIDDLMRIGNLLERDSLNVDDIDKHLAVIVIRGKKQVLEVIEKEVVHLPPVSSIRDVPAFESALNQLLKKVGSVLGRQSKVIHIFAKKYAGRLKTNLGTMTNHHKGIRELISEYDSAVAKSDEITDMISQIDALKNSRQEGSKRIEELRRDIGERDAAIAFIRNLIAKIKSSDRYCRYVDLKNNLDAFAGQKAEIRARINSQFAKISRPLGRYEYGSALDKDQKKILSGLIADPFSMLVAPNLEPIGEILENVKRGISSGSISVKDVPKTLSYIAETAGSVDAFVRQISEYYAEYRKLEEEMSAVKSDDLQTTEEDLAKSIAFKESSEERIQVIRDDMDAAASRIILLKSQIEDALVQSTKFQYTLKS